MRCVLASTSPQRRELLLAAGLKFEPVDPRVQESLEGEPIAVARGNAEAKARAVGDREAIVIGADQVLSFRGRAFGKPRDHAAAREQLALLSGQTHELVTAVAVGARGEVRVAHDVARLTMHRLSGAAIDRYLATDEWQGCAGGYRIEGRGIWLFSAIEGDFTGIRGLPLLLLGRMLSHAGVELP